MPKMDFAALLCSRLCHDLVSPVGAINNGLEILEEEQDASMRDAVLDLITKSTQQTANKLQFFRLAFGAAGGFSAHLDVSEAEKAMRALLNDSKVELEWQSSASSLSKNMVKLLLNLGLTTFETLIRGGSLRVEVSEDSNQYTLKMTGVGNRIILQDSVKAALLGEISEEEIEPRTAPAFLAATIIGECDGQITISDTDDEKLEVKAVINSDN